MLAPESRVIYSVLMFWVVRYQHISLIDNASEADRHHRDWYVRSMMIVWGLFRKSQRYGSTAPLYIEHTCDDLTPTANITCQVFFYNSSLHCDANDVGMMLCMMFWLWNWQNLGIVKFMKRWLWADDKYWDSWSEKETVQSLGLCPPHICTRFTRISRYCEELINEHSKLHLILRPHCWTGCSLISHKNSN